MKTTLKMKNRIFSLFKRYDISFDETLFDYGYSLLYSYLLFLLITLPFLIYFHIISNGLFFFISYGFLRKKTGGFHFNSSILCIITSSFIVITICLLSKQLYLPKYHIFSLILIYSILIILTIKYLPIDHKNKRLNSREKKLYKLQSIYIEIGYVFLYFIFHYLNYYNFCNIILYIGAISNVSALLGLLSTSGGMGNENNNI